MNPFQALMRPDTDTPQLFCGLEQASYGHIDRSPVDLKGLLHGMQRGSGL